MFVAGNGHSCNLQAIRRNQPSAFLQNQNESADCGYIVAKLRYDFDLYEEDEYDEVDGDFYTTVDMKKSFAVYGENFTNLLQYSKDCIMICSQRTGHLLNVVTM